MPYDKCKGLRKTYSAVLNYLTSNRVVLLFMAGLPQIYILTFMIVNSTMPSAFVYSNNISGTGFSIFAILFVMWILALYSIIKTMPNLLSLSIFIYKCLAHWSLVSNIIVLVYMSQYIGARITGYLTIGFLPPTLLLLFTADILRTQRAKMYQQLEQPTLTEQAIGSEFTDSTV